MLSVYATRHGVPIKEETEMATHLSDPITATEPAATPGGGPAGDLQELAQAPPVDALHAHGRLRRARGAGDRARRGVLRVRPARQALPRRALGAVLREHRPRPRRAGGGRRAPGEGARLLHQLELRAPALDRAGGADREPRARGTSTACSSPPAARRRSRVGVEAREGLPRRPRRAPPAQDRSRATSPTTAPRWGRSPRPGCRRCASRSSR